MTLRTHQGDRYVEVVREISGLEPDQVLTRFTTPEHVSQWWGGGCLQIEPEIGGRYVVAFPALGRTMSGRVLKLGDDALSFSWTWGQEGEPVRRVDVWARPGVDGGSELTVRHSPYGDGPDEEAEAASHLEGWAHFLSCIE